MIRLGISINAVIMGATLSRPGYDAIWLLNLSRAFGLRAHVGYPRSAFFWRSCPEILSA